MTASQDYTVECDEHGRQVAAVVCRHMINAKDRIVGFVENSDDPNDLQAWCDACEAMFLREGEMTEAFEKSSRVRSAHPTKLVRLLRYARNDF